mmetsp:Transcript_16874/g.43670  ORF Transcript_16874/g.43670 Transcript_16874/m.43670 type:complete len:229 (-) Transcript_16874:96-782(-)
MPRPLGPARWALPMDLRASLKPAQGTSERPASAPRPMPGTRQIPRLLAHAGRSLVVPASSAGSGFSGRAMPAPSPSPWTSTGVGPFLSPFLDLCPWRDRASDPSPSHAPCPCLADPDPYPCRCRRLFSYRLFCPCRGRDPYHGSFLCPFPSLWHGLYLCPFLCLSSLYPCSCSFSWNVICCCVSTGTAKPSWPSFFGMMNSRPKRTRSCCSLPWLSLSRKRKPYRQPP